mmetsp:Transcript_99750/g.192687  ORF Transcript_99750/g.192687 Transcript_99750/m.192687 type:complete len:643 (-) Transcript_99750:69-1997(-)|eukprot:CAMPEP_0172670404 /NCGR_PEP_ID=MMETSP1074-20121228/10280_1 /TAXON_ID=2916 /ORGANISM="Ceratium fusus, Strain PA161109" /LENGTH=642 /DNA_ID=CAMNT_0013487315 /DNA_START=89 /DNA_END=2017 /DNA_ORIENTATION=-
MMSFSHRLAAVVAVFLVSVLLQGCTSAPKECEGAAGTDMEACKKCVESANKNSDATAKTAALKLCAQAAKEAAKATTTATTTKNAAFQQVAEDILGNAAKASLDVASSVVQTSAPVELDTSSRSTGRSVGSARARQKMAGQVITSAGAGQDDLFNGIESQQAVKTSQVTSGASTGQDSSFDGNQIQPQQADITAQIRSDANEGQESPHEVIKSQTDANTAQVGSVASAGPDGPGNPIASQPLAITTQERSAANEGQASPHNFIEFQPAANVAQVDDDVASGLGNVPNSAESHLQTKPTQTKAAVVETEASARARAEAEAEAAQARAGAAAEAQLTQSQQEATSAQATDHVVSASMDNSHHSTEPQRRENVVEGTDLISSGFSANSDDSHRIAEHQLLSNAMEATDPVSSAVSANVDTLHHSVESQLQANAGGATDPESNGVSNIMDTWHNSVKPELQANAAEVDRLAAATRGAQATQPALQNGPANGALFDFVHGKKTTNDAEVDVRAATAQAAVPVLQRGPVNEGPANAVEQKSADPGAIAEITAQPWPPSDKSYNTGGNSARLQNQLMVDRQKQVASTARGSVVHLHKGSQEEKEGPNFNKAENSARAPNKDSFQTVVGTSGKVAHVGRPRHGARGARKR